MKLCSNDINFSAKYVLFILAYDNFSIHDGGQRRVKLSLTKIQYRPFMFYAVQGQAHKPSHKSQRFLTFWIVGIFYSGIWQLWPWSVILL